MAIDEAALTGPAEISVEVLDEGVVTVVSLAGELDLANAGELRECLVSPEVFDAEQVHIDLTKVTFLDSSSIGLLVAACKRVRNGGGTFSVSCSEGVALRVLQISGLVEYFEMESSADHCDSIG